MSIAAGLDLPTAATHQSHPLHAQERIWPETNCYVDLWIELLHGLGADPLAALAFTASAGFDGEQWEFFKYPPEDLRSVYGVEVSELNIWRSVEEHLVVHLELGHLLTLEADAMYLPDTAGDAYHVDHQKTTIAPIHIDATEQRLTYFHGRGCYELSGLDYEGIVRSASPWPPYAERIDLSRFVRRSADDRRVIADELLAEHLMRRPEVNPIPALRDRVLADTDWLRSNSSEGFHRYAFGTLRQCGSWAEVFADFLDWLCPAKMDTAVTALRELSSTAKMCQFKLARVASGRDADLSGLFATMAEHWDTAYEVLVGGR